jgi:aldehyde:ferredoxin oxidoreductase
MLDEYYELHGWEKTTGLPRCKTLGDLDLGDVAAELDRMGKLAKD